MAKNTANSIAVQRSEKTSPDIGIWEAAAFSALIRHERNRADRTGKAFALVVFAFDEGSPTPARVKLASARLTKEMRSIDEIGWMENGRIGVLLPATMLEGAHQYVHRASVGDIGLSHKVFIYPDHWMRDYRESPGGGETQIAPGLDLADSFSIEVPKWKRGLDIVGASLGLFVLWPFFLAVAAYIKLVSPGPAFFTQKRVGQGGKLFTFIKFRTMKPGNDHKAHEEHIIKRIRSGEALAKLDDKDSRIIPGGRLLRKLCIDELPQLFNVLRGDMSLVGPRPCIAYEAREFLMWHTHRFDVMPGMTGLWQVSGKNKLTFAQMIRLDIAYASNMSLVNDLSIIARTIPAIALMVLETLGKKIRSIEKQSEEVAISEEQIPKRAMF